MSGEAAENFGLRTDAFVEPPGTVRKRRSGCTVIHTPEYRGYHYGNLLILDEPPQPHDLQRWLDVWHAEFGGVEGVQKRVLEWEAPGPVSASLHEAAREHGLEAGSDDVLVASRPKLASVSSGVSRDDIRPVSDDAEWRAVVEMIVANEDEPEFSRWRMEQYGPLVETGRGEWWAAWRSDEPAATAGIFWSSGLVRFQSVLTAEAARARGYATTLVSAMLERHRHRGTAVIVAEQDSQAGRIYRRLGFEPVSVLEALEGELSPA